jgi:hypothetical protein
LADGWAQGLIYWKYHPPGGGKYQPDLGKKYEKRKRKRGEMEKGEREKRKWEVKG